MKSMKGGKLQAAAWAPSRGRCRRVPGQGFRGPLGRPGGRPRREALKNLGAFRDHERLRRIRALFGPPSGWRLGPYRNESNTSMVTIRLTRRGARNQPFYHVVVTDSRKRQGGLSLEHVGFFNPIARKGEHEAEARSAAHRLLGEQGRAAVRPRAHAGRGLSEAGHGLRQSREAGSSQAGRDARTGGSSSGAWARPWRQRLGACRLVHRSARRDSGISAVGAAARLGRAGHAAGG